MCKIIGVSCDKLTLIGIFGIGIYYLFVRKKQKNMISSTYYSTSKSSTDDYKQERISFSDLKDYLTKELEKQGVIKKGQDPKDTYSIGIQEFNSNLIKIIDDKDLPIEEKKNKIISFFQNPQNLEKRKKIQDLNLNEEYNKIIDSYGIPSYIRIDLSEFNIPEERARENLMEVTKEILLKTYDKGLNHAKNSISPYIDTLQRSQNTETISNKLQQIREILNEKIEQ